jgi:dethiobiotin synthetase
MKNTFFVTGTDTHVGKTLISAALLCSANQQGLKAFGLKPVAAGCTVTPSGLRSADAELLMAHSNVSLPYSQVNPIALAAPKAPHIAAFEEGRKLNLDRIEGILRGALMNPANLRLVEGAGGWRVPLNESESLSELPKRLEIPVILVVGMRLGCINHALLTAEAIVRDGLKLAAWVANSAEETMESVDENIATLKFCLPAPCLGYVPRLEDAMPENIAKYLSLEPLLE